MKIVRRGMLLAGGAMALLVTVASVLYLGFVHPNDARLATDSLRGASAPITVFKERVASLLVRRLTHSLDMDTEAFVASRAGLMAKLPEFALQKSSRFSSPYQVYAPIGSYPYRLDARDALFIPAGRTLRIMPRVAGRLELRSAAVAVGGDATLDVRVDGREIARVSIAALPAPLQDRSAWFRNVARYWRVDRRQDAARWQDLRYDVELTEASVLEWRCESAPPGCLLGDVELLRETTNRPRNVLVILVDTLRGDGLVGGHAPEIGKLAGEATVYRRAMAPGNMTSPSTNALLSCHKPSDLGPVAFMYAVSDRYREEYYDSGRKGFAHYLRESGRDTTMIGNVSVISEAYGVGVNHGFARQVAIERDAYDTPDTTVEAVEWLRTHGDQPFALYLHYNGPHAPYRAPLRDLAATFPGWSTLRSYPAILRWLYQAEIRYTDRYVAHVLRTVKELGIDDDTMIVFTADHGDQHTERPFVANEVAPDFKGAYFDHGATLYDDEIRVPLIVKAAGQREGRQVDAVVSTLDVGPTVLDAMGVAAEEEGCTGRSLLGPTEEPRVIGAEAFQARAIVFDGRFKYIRAHEPTDKRIYEAGAWGGERRLYMVRDQVGSSRVDLQACKLEYSIVSPK